MVPYIVTFCVTLFFSIVDDISNRLKYINRMTIFCVRLLIVTLPAILAGVRHNTIGTDVNVYASTVFNLALNHSWGALDIPWALELSERGFWYLAIVVADYTSNIGWFLFSISFFINLFVYLSLSRMRGYCSIFIGEFIYLFIYYNQTLNMMRQWMAMAVILLSFTYFRDKRYLISGIGLIFASLFQNSAIIAVPIFMLYYILKETNALCMKSWEKMVIMLMLIGSVTIVFFFKHIISGFIGLGILPVKYMYYIASSNEGFLSLQDLLVYGVSYVILFANRKYICNNCFFLMMAFLDLVFYTLKSDMVWLYRISCYFSYFKIFSLSQCSICDLFFKQDYIIHKSELNTIIVLIITIGYWFIYTVYLNHNQTYPYVFA